VVPDKVNHFALVNWVTTTLSRELSFRLDERGGMPGMSMAWDVTSFRAICLGEQSLVIVDTVFSTCQDDQERLISKGKIAV
jgi:hypothetical protein